MAHKSTAQNKVGFDKSGPQKTGHAAGLQKIGHTAKVQTEDPRQRYEQRLRQREQELEQALAKTVAQALDSNVNDAQDVADQAVAGYQKEMLFSQGTVRNAQLRLVRQALNRLAEGSYGDCVRCYQPIGPKRIEALPWTPYCIDCQERIEKGDI